MKTRRSWITAFIALSMAALVGSCKDDEVGVVGVCPIVVSTSPTDGASGVPLDKVITVTFNEAMNPATITPAAFSLLNTGPIGGRMAVAGKNSSSQVAGELKYNGETFTMSFTPSAKLVAGSNYSGTILTSVKDLKGNALQVNYTWAFSTGTTLSPTILSTDPANGAAGMVLNKVVSAIFSEPMNPLTINGSSFTVKQGTAVIPGTVSYAGTKASFNSTSPFAANTLYTATITTAAKNVAGTTLSTDYVWSFTTGTITAPKVNSTDPANLSAGVALNKVISVTFSEAMNPLTITSSTFTVMSGTIPVLGTVIASGTGATFTPTGGLAIGNIYTATITTGAKNAAGVPLANDFVWTFSTNPPPSVTSTDPLNLATGVALNKTINATFSEAMDPLTITSLTFIVNAGATAVAGSVTYLGNTATFSPSGGLLSGTDYTATITTGAKNPGGIPLANDFVWNFSTSAPLGPQFVDLKSVARFGIIAGVGVSNNAGFSIINNMDVGIYPGTRSSITGFPPATVVNGAVYASDDIAPPGVAAMLLDAQNDLTAAYIFARDAVSPAPAVAPADLGGKTLAPGIYTSASTMLLQNGNLTLDAQGDANAVWIFQIGAAFTSIGTGPFPSPTGGNVILAGGAQAKNVFWQVSSSATIGDYTSFKGNILSFSSITMNSGAKSDGRMLARNGSVIMTLTNTINKP